MPSQRVLLLFPDHGGTKKSLKMTLNHLSSIIYIRMAVHPLVAVQISNRHVQAILQTGLHPIGYFPVRNALHNQFSKCIKAKAKYSAQCSGWTS